VRYVRALATLLLESVRTWKQTPINMKASATNSRERQHFNAWKWKEILKY